MIIPATMDHARSVLKNLCAESGWDQPTEKDVAAAMARSQLCWAGVVNGETVCIAGAQQLSLICGGAYIWMLTSNVRNRHALARESVAVTKNLLEIYQYLSGHVDLKHTRSVRWLRWLGFEIHDPVFVGGRKIAAFTKGRD